MSHSRPHYDISTEFHTEHGPFTVVPLPGNRSSVVCVVAPREAERLAQLSGAALNAEIERRCHSILGRVEVEPGHGAFPLMVATAERARCTPGRARRRGCPCVSADRGPRAQSRPARRRDHRRGRGRGCSRRGPRRRRGDRRIRAAAARRHRQAAFSRSTSSTGPCSPISCPSRDCAGSGLYALDRVGILRRALMREGVAPRAAIPVR